ncbi:AAA family ATPase [Skermanella sp. TT6]|uniref:AAA family ATPase n=1 Tax=Skermanella cutis TaxID=2775420 RepID=A0ABX7B253_9PROT|nr:AAA family ATPase [Skermanella sp. TT6]QQP87512.1 AAA family ATPase [Skermanella sp. TT6]
MTSSPNVSPRTSPTHTIAIYNHKGGVGKTTVSLNLSVCLAAAGYRCLLVDIDPQQSSTTVLSRTGASPNLVDVIRKQAVIEDALHETVVQNLWIIPSTRALTLLETGLDDRVRPNHGLKRYLTFSEDRFDFVVIDCPPAMGLLSLSALIAADSVLIPTTSGAFSIQGVQRTVETVNALRGGLSPGLVVNGILVSLFEGTRRDQQTLKDLGSQFSGLLYRNRIRFDPEILKAEVKRAPSTLFNRGTHSTQDYIFLTAELLGRIHRHRRLPDAEFSFDDMTRTITETLAKPEFTTLAPDGEGDAGSGDPEKPAADGADIDATGGDRRGGRVRQLALAAAIFVAGMVCGGSLATWLGPETLAMFQTAGAGD